MEQQTEHGVPKIPTGMEGFDYITGGGLPRHRTTVLLGAPGSGKTVFALQTLVNGILEHDEPGIFVAFEENTEAVADNALGFGWDLRALRDQGRLVLLDARLSPDTVRTGDFELSALLATLASHARAIGARRIVFDAVDVLLMLLDDPSAERTELYRIHEWPAGEGLSGILTVRSLNETGRGPQSRYGFIQYMADCAVQLQQTLVDRIALRSLRVLKYRGSGVSGNEYPFVITGQGIQVASPCLAERRYPVFTDQISTGIARLDAMLNGGYYRGTSVLITGAPGSAKSTLGAAFVQAACERGERALLLSFDEDPSEFMRNQASVNVRLHQHVESGLLRIVPLRSEGASADEHLIRVKELVEQHQPACAVVDPLSAMLRSGGPYAAMTAALELVQFIKSRGITLLCTSLTRAGAPVELEGAELRISTIADTWIQLSFAVQGGERNRALTIVKARGIGHSNQVRELVLSDAGISIRDVYSAGGEVLMGSLRLQKEAAEELERSHSRQALEARRRELELSEAQLRAELAALQQQLEARRTELEQLGRDMELREQSWAALKERLAAERRADVPEREQ